MPQSKGYVLWGPKGRKRDKIDHYKWETPSPHWKTTPTQPWLREMQPTDVQELPHTYTQTCTNLLCILQSCSETWIKKPARAGHPSIIKQAGDKGRDMETWVGGWEVLMKWGDKGFRGYEYIFFFKWLAESCPIFSTASGSQRITHSTVNWVTANVNYELCFLHIRAFYRRPWGRWRKKSSRLTS